MERGITWFDTADAYSSGTSEHVLGLALRGRRDRVTIATKGGYLFTDRGALGRRARLIAARALRGRRRPRSPAMQTAHGQPASPPSSYLGQDFSPSHLTAALDASLRRLRTDHIHVYQLHGFPAAGATGTSPWDLDAIAQWADTAISAGKIGQLGIAAETLAQAQRTTSNDALTVVQLPFGMLDPEARDSLIPHMHASGRQVIVRGVLGAGLLGGPPLANEPKAELIADVRQLADEVGVSSMQLALWFVGARSDIDVVLAGASSPRHLDQLVGWFDAPPPGADVLNAIETVIDRHA